CLQSPRAGDQPCDRAFGPAAGVRRTRNRLIAPVMTTPVYLDCNATTPIRPAVIEAVSMALAETGNASSVHRFGRLARRAVETAREQVAALVGAQPREVVFTSGGTEANNLAIASARGNGLRLIVSAVEHDSILQAAGAAVRAPV